MTTETFKFKKGQKLHLDQIWDIMGLAGGNWWYADDPADPGGSAGEDVTIIEDITIKVTVDRRIK